MPFKFYSGSYAPSYEYDSSTGYAMTDNSYITYYTFNYYSYNPCSNYY